MADNSMTFSNTPMHHRWKALCLYCSSWHMGDFKGRMLSPKFAMEIHLPIRMSPGWNILNGRGRCLMNNWNCEMEECECLTARDRVSV